MTTAVAHSSWFKTHFDSELSEATVEQLKAVTDSKGATLDLPVLGSVLYKTKCEVSLPTLDFPVSIDALNTIEATAIKPLSEHVSFAFAKQDLPKDGTDLQKTIQSIMTRYVDLYYPLRTPNLGHEIRLLYCLHILGHVLTKRRRILQNNAKVKETPGTEARDQGLTRPGVVVLLPFKDSAYRVVMTMIDLMFGDGKTFVTNRSRFEDDFGPGESVPPSKKARRPADYEQMFAGNTDDAFRIGIAAGKRSLKLYVDFYSSDIILASPLGLRMATGADTEKHFDCDFLSSVEVLVLDQADVFLMQNWSHVLHILEHIHRQPLESHGVDFSRVRMWYINGWSKYYRQTLVFSSFSTPELKALTSSRNSSNFAGQLVVPYCPEPGALGDVLMSAAQSFQRFKCTDASSEADARFEHFIRDILPQYREGAAGQTLIFIPSYFDFVRLRNYFKREELSFVQICEYTKNNKISRARDMFYHGHKQFLLYTERFHFYRRYHIRGVHHVIFYQLPVYPHFYSELCNMIGQEEQPSALCTVLYCALDSLRLVGTVGLSRAQKMLASDKGVHLILAN